MKADSGINEALVNVQTSFAFKLFNRPQLYPLREVAQEMVVLSHPVVQKHKHIITLEGICWDILEDNQAWPVLVFEKSHLGDLRNFAKLERFKDLSIDHWLNLCVDVGTAIRDMHHNGIIHGDIKPGNVLIFEDNSRILAKVADFGFATCFQSHNDLILMPKSEPWNAPERHSRPFRPTQGKQMDVYSFGLLCFWLIFKAGSSVDLPLPPDATLEIGQFVSFDRDQPEKNLIQLWRRDNRLTEWVCWLLRETSPFDNSTKDCLTSFFRSTLTSDPQSRGTDFELLLDLLAPNRVTPRTLLFQESSAPEQEKFEIPLSIYEFYDVDFRLRKIIVDSLKALVTASAHSTIQHISSANAALQLALCYTIGLGGTKDDDQAKFFLNKSSFEYVDLQSRVQLIKHCERKFASGDVLFPLLDRQGYIDYIDFAQHYRERQLLSKAEICYAQEARSIKQVFGKTHVIYSRLLSRLAMIIGSQSRWKEAEEILLEETEIAKETHGINDNDTLTSMANLASIYMDQSKFKEAENLQRQVIKIGKRILSSEHPKLLANMGNLASLLLSQGRWKAAAKLNKEVLHLKRRILGVRHSSTLVSMGNLASTLMSQERLKEAKGLVIKVMNTREKMLGAEHSATIISKISLASMYKNQGQWEKAEKLNLQMIETSSTILSNEDSITMASIGNLASTYSVQGKWKEAEDLQRLVMNTKKRLLGAENLETLISMNNLASTLWHQGKWMEAERLETHIITNNKLGVDHPKTLIYKVNLAVTYATQGQWKKAKTLELEVVNLSLKTLGVEHSITLTTMSNLAATYRNLGQGKEAEDLERLTLKIRMRLLGIEHLDTLISMSNLASTLWKRGKFREAEKLQMKTMKIQKRILKMEHPLTLTTMGNMTSMYRSQGQWGKAEELGREVLEIRKKLFGAEHPDTLTSIGELAMTLSTTRTMERV